MSHGLLIVGGGLAAQRCCETLRALGHDGPITIAGAEGTEPYDRPPLSKEGLAGAADPRFRPREWYAAHGVALRLGAAAVRLHPGARTVELAGGERLRYDDLLIATGSRPVMLPALAGFANVQALRTLRDARRLREAIARRRRCHGDRRRADRPRGRLERTPPRRRGDRRRGRPAAARRPPRPRGRPAPGRVAPRGRRRPAARRRGVRSARAAARGTGRATAARDARADGARIERLDGSGSTVVVVAVGVRPEAAWLEGSGLDPRGVHRRGRPHRLPHVFAAGDVTGGGHWEAAARQGAAVARALLGLPPAAPAPPSFWSDQLGLRLQCVGDARGRPRHDRRRRRGPRLRGGLPARGPHQRRPARRPLRAPTCAPPAVS